jgi:hypothetical protein
VSEVFGALLVVVLGVPVIFHVVVGSIDLDPRSGDLRSLGERTRGWRT